MLIETCEKCGRRYKTVEPGTCPYCLSKGMPPQPPDPEIRNKDTACGNRGKSLRTVEVSACCGSKQSLYIWECAVHGECTKGRDIEGVQSCKRCPDISAP